METEKQKKLIQLFTENLGNKKPLSIYDMMLKAGYSKASAHQQTNTLAGIKDKVDDIVKIMRAKRTKSLDNISDKKLKEASARDNVYIADVLTKNIELLSGNPTERNENKYDDEQIKAIAERVGGNGESKS